MTSDSIQLSRVISIDSQTKERLETLAKHIVDTLYYKICCNMEAKIIEYTKVIDKTPEAIKMLGWHLDHYTNLRNTANFWRINKAYYREVYRVLTQEIDNHGRVISLVPSLGKAGIESN